MKKNLLKTICMALVAMLCVTNVFAQFERTAPERTTLKLSTAIKQQTPTRGDVIYTEGFEGTSGTSLPAGWTKTSGTNWITIADGELYSGVTGAPFEAHGGTRGMGRSWQKAGNTWAFSAGIPMEASVSYTIKFWFEAPGYPDESENDDFEVKIGTAQSSASMTNLIFSNVGNDVNYWTLATGTFIPTADGTYYLGFHDLNSKPAGIYISIDDITIESQGVVEFCPEVTDLQAEIQGKDVKLTWTAADGEPTNYKVYNGNTLLTTTKNTYHVAQNIATGTYTFGVEAIYSDGCEPLKVTTPVVVPLILSPIRDLSGACDDGTLTLSWTEPEETVYEPWITYSSEEINLDSGLGLKEGGNMQAGARFTAADLNAIGVSAGSQITQLKIAISTGGVTLLKLRIWEGGSSITSAGTLKVDQTVDLLTVNDGEWTTIDLATPYTIDVTKELRIGYYVTHAKGSYPVLFDNGPREPNKSDLIYAGGWSSAYVAVGDEYDLNVCVMAHFTGDVVIPEVIRYDIYQDNVKLGDSPTTSYTEEDVDGLSTYCVVAIYDNDATSAKVCKPVFCGTCKPPTDLKVTYPVACGSATLTWTAPEAGAVYNIYRNGIRVKANQALTTYTIGIVKGVEYTWEVKTVCGDVESEAATDISGCDLGVKENAKAAFSIVPNPASGNNITITAGNNFNKIEVISFLGQTVISQPNAGNTALLDISNLPSGVYFVRIATENGANVQKFVKQ